MSRPTLFLGIAAMAALWTLPVTPVALPTDWCGIDVLPVRQGPAFCRTGAGHPVHGRLWCIDKGHELGGPLWRRAAIPDLRLEAMPERPADGSRLSPEVVTSILGQRALRLLFDAAGRPLERGTLGGSWRGSREQGVVVLEIFDGSSPVAELTDHGVDGSVDVVLVTMPERLLREGFEGEPKAVRHAMASAVGS